MFTPTGRVGHTLVSPVDRATNEGVDTAHLRILLVDDSEDAFVLTRALLRSIPGGPRELDWESSYEDGLNRVLRGGHDAVLVDYRLGAKAGTELIREAIARGCTTPMIMVTGEVGRDADLEAMEAGAADYLVKGRFDGSTLERSLRYAIQRRQRKALQEEIRGGQQTNAVGRLAAGLSGELNDLAATISGHAEMLLRCFGPKEVEREDAVAIHLASSRLAELTQQLYRYVQASGVPLDLAGPQVLRIGDGIHLVQLPPLTIYICDQGRAYPIASGHRGAGR